MASVQRAIRVAGAVAATLVLATSCIAAGQFVELRPGATTGFMIPGDVTSLDCFEDGTCLLFGGHRGFRFTGQAWEPVPTPSASYDSLGPTDCGSPTLCIVGPVDSRSVEVFDGSAWTSVTSPYNQLTGASCVPSGRCLTFGADYEYGLRVAWFEAGTFTEIEPPPSGVTDVECLSEDWCLVAGQVDGVATTAVLDPSGWHLTSASGVVVHAIACGSPTSCVAATRSERYSGPDTFLRWDGMSWSPMGAPGSPFSARSVACRNDRACIAVVAHGDARSVLTWSGGESWQAAPPVPPGANDDLSLVDCKSTSCVAVSPRAATNSLRFDGTAWSPVPSIPYVTHPSEQLWVLSCAHGGACLALGTQGTGGPEGSVSLDAPLAQRFTGRSFDPIAAPPDAENGDLRSFTDVDCPAATWCVAVAWDWTPATNSSRPRAFVWDGSWHEHAVPTVVPNQRLSQVECTSRSWCLALGFSDTEACAAALRWDGARWASVPPSPFVWPELSCPEPDACVAAMAGSEWEGTSGRVASLDGGTWSLPVTLDLQDVSVSCWSKAGCAAVGTRGTYQTGYAPVVYELVGGVWQAVDLAAGPARGTLGAVSCRADRCLAMGFDQDAGASIALERLPDGRWLPQRLPTLDGADLSVTQGIVGPDCDPTVCLFAASLMTVPVGEELAFESHEWMYRFR